MYTVEETADIGQVGIWGELITGASKLVGTGIDVYAQRAARKAAERSEKRMLAAEQAAQKAAEAAAAAERIKAIAPMMRAEAEEKTKPPYVTIALIAGGVLVAGFLGYMVLKK